MRHTFHLLGPPEVRRGTAVVEVGHARRLSVLAVLLVDVNQVVGVDKLLARVWGDTPPRQVKAALYSYMSRLRSALDIPIVRRSGGYVLEADPQDVDLHRFRALVSHGRHDEALALVRGEPFEGLHGEWFASLRETLAGEIAAAELDHVDTLLAAGEHESLLPGLTTRASERPLDERLAGQLMRALIGADRRSDALAHYTSLRHRLADELGLDPGPALRDLAASLHRPQWNPSRFPPSPEAFTGMERELAALDQDAPIVTITGLAGAGKTRLALHWAHEHAADYPDGRLFADLGDRDPADVVREFITALGTTPDGIPPEPHAQTALYRTLLADRRMLVVLDNAADTAQVVPLLPGTARCRVIVTSRERLPGLVTAHGARPVVLG
ncbi:AfsR/SARP family transcriptional regulator [Lentzea sp.]|uniref:AfsR/SARP family transcriptional regulator n=1 Tax=Lentzea sp. TaxID=56099 RepID=UPI002C3F69F3|nr:BTAD domain-containing putative transcriptional regulator [Lentzea sp.]HUQ55329.1 BTAD domain-containing putative transcriptional regulator [Lentzea sp.]